MHLFVLYNQNTCRGSCCAYPLCVYSEVSLHATEGLLPDNSMQQKPQPCDTLKLNRLLLGPTSTGYNALLRYSGPASCLLRVHTSSSPTLLLAQMDGPQPPTLPQKLPSKDPSPSTMSCHSDPSASQWLGGHSRAGGTRRETIGRI